MIIGSNNFSTRELRAYNNFRKKIFFLKADIDILPSQPIIRISEKNIENIFQKKMRETVTKVEPMINQSTLHVLYSVYTVNKNRYVFKINPYKDLYKEFHFFQDCWSMNEMKKKQLPFVPIYTIDLSRLLIPYDYEIIGFIDGSPLYEKNIKANMKLTCYKQLGYITAQLHKVKGNCFGGINMYELLEKNRVWGLFPSWRSYLTLHFKKYITICIDKKIITNHMYKKIIELLTRNNDIEEHISPVILHNDLGAHNVYVKNNKIVAIIDWEDMICGDPLYEIANISSFLYKPSQKIFFKSFLKGYSTIHRLPADFKRRYWYYYLRISIMKTALREKYGKPDTTEEKVKPSNRISLALEMLMKY